MIDLIELFIAKKCLKGGDVVVENSDDPDVNPFAYRVQAKEIAKKKAALEAKKLTNKKLLEAEQNGEDVCWECGTINPPRCAWGCCLSGKNGCSENYNGSCYYHDD